MAQTGFMIPPNSVTVCARTVQLIAALHTFQGNTPLPSFQSKSKSSAEDSPAESQEEGVQQKEKGKAAWYRPEAHCLAGSYKDNSMKRKQRWAYKAPVMVGQGTRDLLAGRAVGVDHKTTEWFGLEGTLKVI